MTYRVSTQGLGGPGEYMPLASQSPYLIIIYSVTNYRPHLSHFWANIKFSRSQLSLFLFIYLPSIA